VGTGFAEVSGNVTCPVNRVRCLKDFEAGTEITLTVNPWQSGFAGWEGGCDALCDDGNFTCSFTINSDVTCRVKVIAAHEGDLDGDGEEECGLEVEGGTVENATAEEVDPEVEDELARQHPDLRISDDYPRMLRVRVSLNGTASQAIFRWRFDPPLPEGVIPYKYVNGTFYDLSGNLTDRTLLELTIADNGRYDANATTGVIEDPIVLLEKISTSPVCSPDGDVAPLGNRDGKVNIGDALVTLRFALGLETPSDEDKCHADVAPLGADGMPNPDGKITIGDALVILRKALGLVSW